MQRRKTLFLSSLCLAGAGSALLLGLLSGFAPRGEGFEVRRRASAQVVSLQASDLPAPIFQAGDGKHVWAVRRPVRAEASGPGEATLAAAQAVCEMLAQRRNGEFISFEPEGIRLSMAGATPLFGFEGTDAGAGAPDAAGLSPLLALDGASAPQLLAVEPFRLSDALDMDGRPVRWQDTAGLMAAYRPLAAQRTRPQAQDAPAALAAPGLASPHALAAADPAPKAHRYQELVENFSRRYNLNTALVYAIIHSESDFSPTLVSGKSAMGLMQLLPSTASGEVHRFLYGRRGNIGFDDLRVPEINIRYGTAYLHILLTRYFQNVTDPLSREYCAIAGYNMGPNRFLRLYGANTEEAMARINAMSADELYEDLTRRLPVRETRAYVAKVRRMKHHYAAQLDLAAALN